MASGYDRRGVFPAPPQVGENQALQQFGFKQGIRRDLNAREMPLDASPDLADVRLDQNSYRQEFGLTAIGGATGREVLGIAEHRYFAGGNEIQRIIRVTRNTQGFAVLQIWDGIEWIDSAQSSVPVNNNLVSMVSTQNKFVFADGKNIYVWNEPTPGLIQRQEFFWVDPTKLFSTISKTRPTRTKRLDRIATAAQIDVSYGGELILQTYWEPKNDPLVDGVYIVRAIVEISYSYNGADFHTASRLTHEREFFYGARIETLRETLGPVLVSIPAEDAEGVTHIRVDLESVELIAGGNPTSNYIFGFDCELSPRAAGDDPPGVEYQTVDDPGGTIEILSADAPAASFIAPFGDRLVALRDEGNPQHLGASADGDITVWTGTDTYSASLLDTVHDPIDALQAMAFLSDNQAALFRQRNIMRISETGDPKLPIAVNPWIEGIGTESPFSLVQARDGVIFVGHNLMVYYWDGGSQPTPIGVPIHNDLVCSCVGGLENLVAVFDPIWEEYWLATDDETWIFELRSFLDFQRLIWRKRSEIYTTLSAVSQF